MTKLFVCNTLSELFVQELLKEHLTGLSDILVVTQSHEVASSLVSMGITRPILLPINGKSDNRAFHEQYMPGVLNELFIDSFPIWKSLAIDRWRFWHNANCTQIIDNCSLIKYDELIISLDMHDIGVWDVARSVSGIPVTAIKTHHLRTPEFLDFLLNVPVDNFVVSYSDEAEFIKTICPEKSVAIARGARSKREEVAFRKKQELRTGFELLNANSVIGVVYDKRDDWQFVRTFHSMIEQDVYRGFVFIVLPYDKRSAELYYSCVPQWIKETVRMIPVDSAGLLNMCDRIIVNRFDEEFLNNLPENIPVTIVDPFNLNLSQQLTLGVRDYYNVNIKTGTQENEEY